ncbi:MAG TPA: AmmeMemoRadiSam system radical SAM enzyme [Anaerolineae bacterium]|nr:AmmeMemoRadiSam system radical SAM enzyme [Anaerolineae bacterium]
MGRSEVRRGLLQESVDEKVRCLTCERRCLLGEGAIGWCRTRRNEGGTIYTLTYGSVSSLSVNPIEKKPLYHFYPGSVALTAGSWSCNFACPWCQNYDISKSPPRSGRCISPEEFVRMAVARGCRGTSISFNEPTLSLEWSLEVFRLARERALYNTYVTNGYMTAQALALLVEAGLDAMNVDVKGDAAAVREFCQADVEVVWRNCRAARKAGVWLELTTLVIPGVNDDPAMLRGIAGRIVSDLGAGVPWHLSAYFPAYRFDAPPTSVATLDRAREVGLQEGLHYVYIGNVVGHPAQHTYCPECGALLIERWGLGVMGIHLDDGSCPRCGRAIPGVGLMWESRDDSLERERGTPNVGGVG